MCSVDITVESMSDRLKAVSTYYLNILFIDWEPLRYRIKNWAAFLN